MKIFIISSLILLRLYLNQKNISQQIEFFDKAILLNPQYDIALNNQGNLIDILKYLDSALSIHLSYFKIQGNQKNIKNPFNVSIKQYQQILNMFVEWNNKDLALILYTKQSLVHHLKKFLNALQAYDIHQILKYQLEKLLNRIFKILELGNKQEAKNFYLAALEKGANEKDQIQKIIYKL
ncbi:unnamed protein product [Paramecium sonneborni]|uniref:Tetratricopeptide repeat protein n=1 Tax=Paramecium sonneborni TaxID=65129 RepID=A0A8S1RVI3_9CILI|nr:unnamed protein product [Paramecium sonneborni]